HSIAASAAMRAVPSGLMRSISSLRVRAGTNAPFARCHLSKKGRMSAAKSLMMGKFSSGAISRRPSLTTLETCVRQVPRGPPVHGHGAGAAHAHAAGKAVRQRRVEMTLNERHDVEHGLVFAPGDLVALVSSLLRAAPERHGQVGSGIGHRVLGRSLSGYLGGFF